MVFKFLRYFLLAVSFLSIQANAKEATAPTSDFGKRLLFCSHGKDSAKFTAEVEGEIAIAGNALLVSDLRPFYSAPFFNKVSYVITSDHTIQIEHDSFSLTVHSDGKGIYQRKGEVESPPESPIGEIAPKSNYLSVFPKSYNLFEPISLECSSPFTPRPIPPTGFSVGN